MVEIIITALLGKLGNQVLEGGNFLQGVRDQVEQLQTELRRVRCFLKDADARQNEDERIREWILEIKNIAEEAEDVLETYDFKVASRSGGRGGGNEIKRRLRRYACILDEAFVLHEVGLKIQSLINRISDITRKFSEYGIAARVQGEGPSSSLQHQIRRSYSVVTDEEFVDLEGDVELLANKLVNMDYAVVSIYGMGGLGKTTMARRVYNDPNVRRYFDGIAWVCVSQQWQTRDILQRLLSKLMPEQKKELLESWKEDDLVRELSSFLRNKRCLLVLDDIWTTDAWECIKHAFPVRSIGSKLLLTSRKRDVVLHIGPDGFHHQPRLLSDQESWNLLEKKIFKREIDSDEEDMNIFKELGKEMVKYCAGLPLAVIVLGGILVTKSSLTEWYSVYKDIKVYIWKGDKFGQEGEVQKILAMSYNDLPRQLKACFLYMGQFPEDYNIEVERLYQMWMAEGMLLMEDQKGEESMMDVAERYLTELVKRCMVQVEDEEVSTIMRFKFCRLHDLMRDLCLHEAREENFFTVVDHWQKDENSYQDLERSNSSSLIDNVRRLIIYTNGENASTYIPQSKKMTGHLRLFMLLVSDEFKGILGPRLVNFQFKKFKMLRILAIEGLDYRKELPNTVGKLIHLRYLSLRGSCFSRLPMSMGNLEHLETLDLRKARINRIENMLWKMQRLRYLYLPYFGVDNKAPMWNLKLDGLNKLEILENFSNRICNAEDFFKLTSLRVLKAIVYRTNLEELTRIIDHISNSSQILLTKLEIDNFYLINSNNGSGILKQAMSPSSLHEMYIRGPVGNLPSYISANLTMLRLLGSEIKDDPMETLGQLPNLRILSFAFDAFVGKEMICQERGFPQLRILDLQYLAHLENLRVENGAMPKLSHLKINMCYKLKVLPEGLSFITTLQELHILAMPKDFKERIQGGEEFPKIRHVPSIVFGY